MQKEYITRINKALVYIEDNLDSDLSLQIISNVALYSPFHFHRLFKAVTSETLNAYISRKRIEKSAMLLIHNKELSITDIADKYGYNSASTFSTTFRNAYGMSPSEFRKTNEDKYSKIHKVNSKNDKVDFISEDYLCNIINHLKWIEMNSKIEITEMPRMHLAYVNQIGVDGIEKAFHRIVKWATPMGLLGQRDTNLCRVFHDSFKVTDEDKVRMSIGVLSSLALIVDGEIELTTFETQKNIVGHFIIEPIEFEKAWSSLFIWMNENGYSKADANPYEIYYNNFNEHPERKCIVDFCIPIK